jgi:hypothetical protein
MIQAAFDYLDDKDGTAAQAFADAVIAEARRKATRASLVLRSEERTQGMKEAEAECHPDLAEAYVVEAQAVKAVEWHRRQKSRAEAVIETWRSEQANERGLRRVG